jgi:peptidoglycan/xylan/chitin deacetylase (PgdA/CDA1 family)
MGTLNRSLIRMGLEGLYFSGAYQAFRPFLGGVGAILTLHHVRPERPGKFQPNRLLEITPEFLESFVSALRRSAIEIVTLDEVHRRLTEGDFRRRFVCITLDDGYRDTLQYAYPILRKYNAPFAVYIATSFPDRLGELWWLALEAVIARNDRIGLVIDGEERHFDCKSVAEKQHLFNQLYWWLRRMKTEEELRHAVRELAARYRVDVAAFSNDLCMGWDEIAKLAEDPLVTIGAHTVNHPILQKVPEKSVRTEMQMSCQVIAAALGKVPEHFAYPVGDASAANTREFEIARDLGFKTAVTTRPGVLFREHAHHLLALPRISVNGEFQRMRYFKVLLSGAATGLANGFRRVDAA